MIVAVASGKGGTGKTTVAVNLALACRDRVGFLDCDVEEPNAHLLLHPEIREREPVYFPVPVFAAGKCDRCGRCVEVCTYNALALVGRELMIFEGLCHGCGGCLHFCPTGALTEGRREIGIIERGRTGTVLFAHGKLRPGEALAPPVIKALRRNAPAGKFTVIDCPPGTACPVVAAVRGADYCLVVTEPTPFGQHDLEAVTRMLALLGIPYGVIINRADLGDGAVEDFCRDRGIPILGKIPFDRRIASSFAAGKPFIKELPEWRETFARWWDRIEGEVPARAGNRGA
ncbi:MAG: ATP-binding protein [Bacillota bacterium]